MPHDPGRCNDMRQTSDCLRRRVGVCSVLEFAGLKDLTRMHIHSKLEIVFPCQSCDKCFWQTRVWNRGNHKRLIRLCRGDEDFWRRTVAIWHSCYSSCGTFLSKNSKTFLHLHTCLYTHTYIVYVQSYAVIVLRCSILCETRGWQLLMNRSPRRVSTWRTGKAEGVP